MELHTALKKCLGFWRTFLCILLPLALLPLVFISSENDDDASGKCAYVALLMAASWMMELLPLAVTSLLPVALFPLLSIMSTSDVCSLYLNKTCMLFVGGK